MTDREVLKSTSRRPTTRRTTALEQPRRPERFAVAWPAAVASEQLRRRPDRILACRKARQSKRSGQSGLRATQVRILRPARDTSLEDVCKDVVRTGLNRANSCASPTTWTAAGATPSAARRKSPMPPPRRTTHTAPPTHAASPWRSSAPHRYHRYRWREPWWPAAAPPRSSPALPASSVIIAATMLVAGSCRN